MDIFHSARWIRTNILWWSSLKNAVHYCWINLLDSDRFEYSKIRVSRKREWKRRKPLNRWNCSQNTLSPKQTKFFTHLNLNFAVAMWVFWKNKIKPLSKQNYCVKCSSQQSNFILVPFVGQVRKNDVNVQLWAYWIFCSFVGWSKWNEMKLATNHWIL
jgi:hypothetical protein